MPTILELEASEDLVKLDPELDDNEMEERCIYVLPHVTGQIDDLAGVASIIGAELTPLEQLYDLLARFTAGDEFIIPDHFHDLHHRAGGIWELKTADLRLFGWFYKRDCFICTDIKDATFVKKGPPGPVQISGSLYHAFGGRADYHRDQLNLDPPKFIQGTHPEDVLSNYVSR